MPEPVAVGHIAIMQAKRDGLLVRVGIDGVEAVGIEGGSAPDYAVDLKTLLFGPSSDAEGVVNLFGALRRAMAKTGYSDLKEFQRVGLTVRC